MFRPLDIRSDRPRSRASGFTLLELLAGLAFVTVLFAVGIPAFHGARESTALLTSQEAVADLLLRGRWMAINSGAARKVVVTPPAKIAIQDRSGKEIVSVDVGAYGVSLSATLSPFSFDGRGFVSPAKAVTILLTAPKAGPRSLTVTPLGKIQAS